MISLSWSGEKYLRPASIEIIFLFASFSFTWLARSVVLGATAAGVAGSFFLSSSVFTGSEFSSETGVAFSVTGVSSTFSATAGDSVFSTVGAIVAEAPFASTVFSSLLSTDVSAVCGSPWAVWAALGFSGVGVTLSADTTWVPKANPMSTEAAPIAYLRMEKRCFFSSFMIKPPYYYIVW